MKNKIKDIDTIINELNKIIEDGSNSNLKMYDVAKSLGLFPSIVVYLTEYKKTQKLS